MNSRGLRAPLYSRAVVRRALRLGSSVALLTCLPAVGGCEERPTPPASEIPQSPTAGEVAPPPDPFTLVPRPPSTPQADADVRYAIARWMLRDERLEDAERALRTLRGERPDDARAEMLLGFAIHKQKRYAEAKPHFERAIALRQSFPEVDHVFYLLGWADYYLGDLEAARRAFEEHRRRVPSEPDTVFALGLVAFDEDRVDDAEELFRTAIEMQTEDPRAARERAKAHARLGDVLLRGERVEEAERSYRAAVELHPDHYEAWAKLARALDRLGRSDEAAAAREAEAAALRRAGRELGR